MSVAVEPASTTEGIHPLPDRLGSIIYNLKEIVFQTDAEGRWSFLNRAWEEITGFSVAESLGVLFWEFVHPDDRQRNQELFQPLIERRKEYCRHEVRYLTKDGGFRWIEVHARLTLDAAGQIIGTSGTLSDIHERRRTNDELRDARQRLEVLLASNPAVVFSCRPGTSGVPWETTFISDNVSTIFGFRPEAYIEDPSFWLTTIHPDDRAEVLRSLWDLESRGESSVRCRTRCGDGSYRWIRRDTRVVTDRAGQPTATFGCMVDETHTRSIEDSLRTHAAILEAVGFAAHRFLSAGSWRDEINRVLEHLGLAAHTSRVYVFENFAGPGGQLLTSQRYEWSAPGVAPQLGNPDLECVSYRDLELGRWVETLGRGQALHGMVREFPPAERAVLEPQGILSLLAVPIFAGREWWGFIGFDDCQMEHEWSSAEIDALQAAARILGAAIRREETESALRYSEALLRTMTDASPIGSYVVDNRTDEILYLNDRFCEIWGIEHLSSKLRRGELRNHDLIPFCVGRIEDVRAFAASCEPLQHEQNRCVVTDYLGFRDGRTIRRFSTQIRDAADQYFGRLYLFEDVTEQKRAEAALLSSHSELEARVQERTAALEKLNWRLQKEVMERRSAQQALADREAHFRTLIEKTSDIIFVVDSDVTIKYASPAVERVLGYEPGELLGRCGKDFVHADDLPRALADFEGEVLNPGGARRPVEFLARHKDGAYRVIEATINNQLDNPTVRGVVVTLRDVSDRRRLEEQFRQAQKMEAVGRLAGGVAHDFNNLLTVICGYSELLTKLIPQADPLQRKVAQIRRAGDRATGLVQQLLAFSRKQIVQPVVLDVNEAVIDLHKMLRRLIGEDIELSIVPAPESVYVQIDRTQFDQIIMNLTVNARDAMPNGGALSITVRVKAVLDAGGCQACVSASGELVVIEVRDTGTGMSEETSAHIFEPFFTTKEVGKGTGLGLSMVYGAIRQIGGFVCFDTELGKGTTFRICLPRVETPRTLVSDISAPDAAGGRERVLLVEDEELVRTMLADTLHDAGYHVLEAHHGEEALELLERHSAHVHLLVTDVVMPRMSGQELAARIAAVRPHTKVMFISGYPRQELTAGCLFLKKPFTPDELLRQVRLVLDANT